MRQEENRSFRRLLARLKIFLLSVPLRLKILGLAMGMILLFGAVTIYNVQTALNRNIDQFLREKGRLVATELSFQAHDYLLINDVYGLTRMLRNTAQLRGDLRYIYILDTMGRVISHSFDGGFPTDLLAKTGNRRPDDGPQLLNTNEGEIWEAAAEIGNGSEGLVLVGVKGDLMRRQIGEITGSLVRTTLLVAGLGILLSLWLTWLITRPVARLLEATKSVRRGDYSINLPIGDGHDELGKLTEGFNAMVRTLAFADKARQDKEQLQRELLHRVMAGQESERKRIARELHDQTGQALASVMLDLRMLENAKSDGETRQSIVRLRKAITEEMTALHEMAVALRPSVLDNLGLIPAVEMLVRAFTQRHGIPLDLTIAGFDGRRADDCVETCVYRIVQESLANAARHAGAKRVSVLLEWRGDKIRGIIEDDGVGFEPELIDGKNRLGVLGMKERAQLCDGSFRVESSPGEGAMVVFEVPVKAGICHE